MLVERTLCLLFAALAERSTELLAEQCLLAYAVLLGSENFTRPLHVPARPILPATLLPFRDPLP